jgi:uncharacterized membrane protein
MLIQKTFHVHQSLTEAKATLTNLRSFRRIFEGLRDATFTADGVLRLEAETGNGFHARADLVELPTDEDTQTLFHAIGGNMEIAGLVEYFEIRGGLTEVQLTLNYSIKSPVHSVLDVVTASIDRFVNRQLRRLQAHLAGAEHTAAETGYSSQRALRPQLAH